MTWRSLLLPLPTMPSWLQCPGSREGSTRSSSVEAYSSICRRAKLQPVLAFRGTRAAEYRKTHLLTGDPGTTLQLSGDREVRLHYSSSYRHLGSIFAPDGEVGCEGGEQTWSGSSCLPIFEEALVWKSKNINPHKATTLRGPYCHKTLFWYLHMGSSSNTLLATSGELPC